MGRPAWRASLPHLLPDLTNVARLDQPQSDRFLSYGNCPHCHKRCYYTRRDARTAARRTQGDTGLRPYRCPTDPTAMGWHLGHLPPDLRAGLLDRPTYRNRKGQP
jgi:hypothetical protein